MRYIYNVLLYVILPFVITRLLWRSVRNPGYRHRISERFGWVGKIETSKQVLWIHAVSVGEVQATRPLIEKIHSDFPDYQILVTTYTPTGAATVEQIYGGSVFHRYVPFDFPGAVNRFITRIKPKILIVMETEIWPNLFHVCNRNKIPVTLVNARLSVKSFKGYSRIRSLAGNTLAHCTMILSQSQEDAQRFKKLGLADHKLYVTGNLKFDCIFNPSGINRQSINEQVTSRPYIWIAASTHEKEEEIVLTAHRYILDEYPDCLLIIAPRHPERFSRVIRLAKKAGFVVMGKSTADTSNAGNLQVYILDVLGELPAHYAISDVAFVGGSLAAVGGHNVLEPASLGLPVLTGPNTQNFEEIVQGLIQCGAAKLVRNAEEIADLVKLYFRDENMRLDAGGAGKKYVGANRGSTVYILEKIQDILAKDATSGPV